MNDKYWIDWQALAAVTTQENGECLVALQQTERLKVEPVYYRQGIEGSLPEIYVREQVAQKLYLAAQSLPEKIGLLVWDGWRPLRVQHALRENMRESLRVQYPDADEKEIVQRLDRFVADPNRADMCPPHLTGGSVDVGLFDVDTSLPLDMGSGFDETSERSYADALVGLGGVWAQAQRYRTYLTAAMMAQGFTQLPTEWWHFDFGNANWTFFGRHSQAIYGAAQYDVQAASSGVQGFEK